MLLESPPARSVLYQKATPLRGVGVGREGVKRNLITPCLVVLSLLGIIILLFSTTSGIGINYDSTVYIRAAHNVINGRGLGVLSGSGEMISLTHYPPLFPTMLAIIGSFGLDPVNISRWLNALFFGATILLVGLLIDRYTSAPAWVPLFGSFLILSSVDMLRIHSMAWSEPAFIFLSLSGLSLLNAYVDNPKPFPLIASSCAIALAFLTRYVGVALIVTGMASIIFLTKEKFSKRIVDVGIFTFITSLPMILWIGRNINIAGTMTDREVGFHPITMLHIKSAVYTILTWSMPKSAVSGVYSSLTSFFPTRFRGSIEVVALVILVVGLLVVSISVVINKMGNRRRIANDQYIARFPYLFALFTISYVGIVVVSISFFDAHTSLGWRILSPVYVSTVLLVSWLIHKTLCKSQVPRLRVATIVLCITFAGSYMVRSAVWVNNNHKDSRGYMSKVWKESEIIGRVRAIPSDIQVYTNGDDAISFLTGKPSYRVPMRVNPVTGQTNYKYLTQVARMRRDLNERHAVLVWLNRITHRWYLPREYELIKE